MEDYITINGAKYVREDSPTTGASVSSRAVVIADRGFIYAGDLTRLPDGSILLTGAVNVRSWDRDGIGGLLSNPVAAGAALDPVAYPIEFPAGTVLQIVAVPDTWGRS